MNLAGHDEGQDPLVDRPIMVFVAFEGREEIAEARGMARDFLASVQAVHGRPVSQRAMDMVQLVVSELVTNASKYAPGPCLLDLEIINGAVQISVWDTSTTPLHELGLHLAEPGPDPVGVGCR